MAQKLGHIGGEKEVIVFLGKHRAAEKTDLISDGENSPRFIRI